MSIFFTADLHFSHANIINYCNRPFDTVHEMNKSLIENFNARVKNDDEVYILGDFAFRNNTDIFAEKLNGRKYLIRGNHDKADRIKGFVWIRDVFDLKFDRSHNPPGIWLAHYAHLTWPRKHYKTWHLFGHSHGKMPGVGLSTDVGVDCWNYAPVSLDELRDYFKNKSNSQTCTVADTQDEEY